MAVDEQELQRLEKRVWEYVGQPKKPIPAPIVVLAGIAASLAAVYGFVQLIKAMW